MNHTLCILWTGFEERWTQEKKALISPQLSVQPPVEKHSSCPDSHLGSGQRSLNYALLARDQPPLWGSQGPQASPWTKLKRKIYFLPQRPIMKFQARRSLPEVTGAHACCAHLWQSALTNSYKGLFFRTGCRKALAVTTASAVLKGTIKSTHLGKTQIVAQMLFIHRPHLQNKMSIIKDIRVKTVKLNMYLEQKTAHFWEGHSEPHHKVTCIS